jgi:hypothetical protein
MTSVWSLGTAQARVRLPMLPEPGKTLGLLATAEAIMLATTS